MNVDVLIGEILTLSMMAFALGMDAFSVGLGMGMAKLKRNQVFQIGVIIGLFHVIMPLGGMIAGQFLSGALGALAGYIGGALLLVLGIQMIVASFNKSGSRSSLRTASACSFLPSASALTAFQSVSASASTERNRY